MPASASHKNLHQLAIIATYPGTFFSSDSIPSYPGTISTRTPSQTGVEGLKSDIGLEVQAEEAEEGARKTPLEMAAN